MAVKRGLPRRRGPGFMCNGAAEFCVVSANIERGARKDTGGATPTGVGKGLIRYMRLQTRPMSCKTRCSALEHQLLPIHTCDIPSPSTAAECAPPVSLGAGGGLCTVSCALRAYRSVRRRCSVAGEHVQARVHGEALRIVPKVAGLTCA